MRRSTRTAGRAPPALYAGSTRTGHPRAGAAHYGAMASSTCTLLYVSPMVRSTRDTPDAPDAPDAPDPVYCMCTDMWDL